MVEYPVHTRLVTGSSPVAATKRPVGQVVKTPPFHGGNMGSSPVRVTTESTSLQRDVLFVFISDYPVIRGLRYMFPPSTLAGGGGRDHGLRQGIAPSADGAWNDGGVSRLARRDQRRCLWSPRFFEKSSKTFYFGLSGDIWPWTMSWVRKY